MTNARSANCANSAGAFQYMRDVDQGELGHNSLLLPRIADNLLRVLDDRQRAQIVAS